MRLGLIGVMAAMGVLFSASPALATDYYTGHRWFWTTTDICYDSYSLNTINIDGGTNKFTTVSSELDQARTDWNNQPSQFTINKATSCNHWVTAANYGNTGAGAYTYRQYDAFGYISDADIEFNSYYAWLSSRTCSAPPGTMDYVQRHELGHFAGFTHPDQSANSVMVPTYDCNKWDTIKSHDSSSLTSVYG